jgi:DNA-binding CsgD family transcriptional regulator
MFGPMTAPLSPFPTASTLSAQTLACVADALAWPLLVLQPDGALLHANLAARLMLRHGRPLLLSPQRQVTPADPACRDAFARSLQGAGSGQPARLLPLTQPAPTGVPARRAHRYNATVRPLALADGAAPVVLVALNREPSSRADLRAFAAAHGLSGAETRVLERLERGESSAAAAAALGVKPATVRSQMASLRRKTGHASVAHLLHTLARLPPLAPPDGALVERE